jgi:hypothetical protein
MPKKLTQEQWIERANIEHNNKYLYLENYKSRGEKILMKCLACNHIFSQSPGSHLNGHGCPKCAMKNKPQCQRATYNDFVIKGNKTHNNKYIYLEEYEGMIIKIPIKCPIHDFIFYQTPGSHIRGAGCPKCSGNLKSNKEDFLEKAILVHPDKGYTYPGEYINANTTMDMFCPKLNHGIFKQTPWTHLKGMGCKICGYERGSEKQTKLHDTFIEEANKEHNNKYTYLGRYENAKTKISIKCPVHDYIFIMTPHYHLGGYGCPKCSLEEKTKTKESFITEALLIHPDKGYTYPGEYLNSNTKMDICCPKHGIFPQSPGNHLRGAGCPKCSPNISRSEIAWLNNLGIPDTNKYRGVKLKIGKKYIKPDAYDPDTNTIYEFYGDFWHGHPTKYNPNDINVISKKTFGELYLKTMEKERLIKESGYNLITIWEDDWNKYKKANNG